MALSKPVGYECEFVDQVPEDYFCKQCKHVAREPNITTCCGECFCKACIDVVIQDKKPCPSCESNDISALGLHVKYQRTILALKIHCTMKDRGCEWTGQLQHLDTHLDVTTGDCTYVDIDCPSDCNQKVQKRNVDTHLAKECPNRNSICPHCSYKATFREVSQHFEVCRYYPLVCPNRCGATFERDDLEDHMKLCGLVKVQCDFSYAGCQAEFLRDNQEKHMEQNTQRHLALMAAATLRITQEQQTFEQKLQEQQEVFEKKLGEQQKEFCEQLQERDKQSQQQLKVDQILVEQLEEKDKQIKTLEERFEKKLGEQQMEFRDQLEQKDKQIKQVEQELKEELDQKLGEQQKQLQEKDKQIKTLEEQLQRNNERFQQVLPAINHLSMSAGIPPYDITFSNIREVKARNGYIDRSPMYTHPGGYKFKLRLWPNGVGGTHVSVLVISLKGDHDDKLKFPARFTMTVQLLNQHRDQDHITSDIQCEVTRERIGNCIGFDWTFISHADLEWNDAKQTQYLKDDCLRFRITKIVML